MRHFLDHFFNPKSVAIVGASSDPSKMNYCLTRNLVSLNFDGKVYPVNPRAKNILEIKAFSRLQDIKDKVDLVVTAVPARRTMDVVKACDVIGVRQLVIVSGGFSEAGEQGQKLHNEIDSFVKEKGIRTLGPNTLSPINTSNNFAVSFNPIKALKRGGVSFAFQSGFYELKINWMLSQMGINKILDMGNKMDINEVDALEYFSQDHDTKVLAMHIESIRGNGRDFFRLLKEISRKKPTIILKSGRTPAGSEAAASHTGSLAGENDVIFDGMVKQTLAIRAQNQGEFFDLAKGFEMLACPRGNRLAIITLSGGEGVMATDTCEMNELKIARLGEQTYGRLKKVFPAWEIPLNPFDVGVCMQFSDPKTLFDTLPAIPEDDNVDCTIMQMPPNLFDFASRNKNPFSKKEYSPEDQFFYLLLKMKKLDKPFAMWRSFMDTQEQKTAEIFDGHYLPVFQSSESAIKVLSAMHRYRVRRSLEAH